MPVDIKVHCESVVKPVARAKANNLWDLTQQQQILSTLHALDIYLTPRLVHPHRSIFPDLSLASTHRCGRYDTTQKRCMAV